MGIFDFFKKKERIQYTENVSNISPAQSQFQKHVDLVQHNFVTVYNRKIDLSTTEGKCAYQILQQCEIMDDSGNIINTSTNLETVINRIPVYEKSLLFLTQCSDSDLSRLHLKSQTQLKNIYNSWLSKKTCIINGAVARSCKASIEYAKTLKTEKCQLNHIIAFCNKSIEIPGLSEESVNFLLETKEDVENSLNTISTPRNKQPQKNTTKQPSEIEKNVHAIQTSQEKINKSGNIQIVAKNILFLLDSLKILSRYSDSELKACGYQFDNGTPAEWYKQVDACKHQIISQVPSRKNYRKTHDFQSLSDYSIQDAFYDCLSNIDNVHGANDKLILCKKAIMFLPDYILQGIAQDGNLFETPYVCGLMIEMYLRIGKWEKAKEYANYFHSINAYIFEPEEYAETLSRIDIYRHTAQLALDFIEKNPGFLQKDMYKALNGKTDHDCLKHFLRCSEQIQKIKSGSTNKLYIKK